MLLLTPQNSPKQRFFLIHCEIIFRLLNGKLKTFDIFITYATSKVMVVSAMTVGSAHASPGQYQTL